MSFAGIHMIVTYTQTEKGKIGNAKTVLCMQGRNNVQLISGMHAVSI